MEEFDFEILAKRIRNETDRKTFQKVFDGSTLTTIHQLANKGFYDVLQHVISTGKEAHVFVATDVSENMRAVKIYKTNTSDFKNMMKYIQGDIRFKDVKKDKRDIVFTWTKKEFKNLTTAINANLSVPMPLGFKNNVLVMEYIGNEDASPRLKDFDFDEKTAKQFYKETIDFMAGLYNAGLVHGDLSEYNILVNKNRLVFIDIGQAVLLTHPNAREFFERDVDNISRFFSKNGIDTSFDKMYAEIKQEKEKKEKKKHEKP